jgi:hypothetical protein
MKIEVTPAGNYLYPDAGVNYGERQGSDIVEGAIKSPGVVVGVTSLSPGDYDRGRNFAGISPCRV